MPDIRFSFQALTAGKHDLGIAGDFTGWEILELTDLGGIYVITLPVESGSHRYKYIVDGVWMTDPSNPLKEPDPFGSENSLLIIHTPEAISLDWEEVYQDPKLLNERLKRYLDIIRIATDQYEIRIHWYPGLECDIDILLDTVPLPCHRLGIASNHEVFHRLIKFEGKSLSLAARFKRAHQELYYGTTGFVDNLADLTPLEIDCTDMEIFSIPTWLPSAVIYQIFPERFCSGDPSLNPRFDQWYYAKCKEPPPEGELLPPNSEYFHFVDDWYDIRGLQQSPWQAEGKADWWSFYGGDLPGVISKLDYLAELGVNTLYFNPLWQAKSNHKYDATDYKSIDPQFGDTGIMKKLVSKAHELGMKIILDVAFNHTGETFWAFQDCVQKGESSQWWNWYDWHKWPLPEPLPADFDPKEYYQCWWGIKDMPDLNYDLSRLHPAENYVRDIRKATPNHSLINYLLESVSWWITEIGIDGFRLDVPDEVPFWFWELFRKHVKQLKADAWLVGEIWHNAQGWVDKRYFDAVMNYAYFKNPVLDYFVLRHISASVFRAKIEEGLALYPFHACQAMMNLVGSHDTWRIASLAAEQMDGLRLALVFQMCFIGAPHIYYGDEILMQGEADPDNRRPFNWKWQQEPKAISHREFVKKLISLRLQEPLLQSGEFSWLDSDEDIIAFRRYNNESSIQVWMNFSEQGCEVCFKGSVLFEHASPSPCEGRYILPPKSAFVLKCQS